ncbi:MAG: hypothetical protein COC01_09860 [Bacteroidetes bacterium]|nr:hypothetical protein [Sphingobacteriaceae bacterium AH-315-L07]PCH65308.1 MAG: hypothetical protein COC01_09860 [Bacteroidota bacterium]
MEKSFKFFWSLILLFSINASTTLAGSKWTNQLYISPTISVGYTFNAGLNYGIEADFGLVQLNNYPYSVNGGINVSSYWIKTKFYNHNINTVNLLVENDHFDLKVGYGLASYKWGYNQVGRCETAGYNIDVAITPHSNIMVPYVGFKKFNYFDERWFWPDVNYKSLYIKYKVPFCIDCDDPFKNIRNPSSTFFITTEE